MTEDRRPIASRELAVSKRIAARLVALGLTPNSISVAGMIAGLAGGGALALTGESSWWFVVAACLVQLRLLCNMFDGMVAVSSGQSSKVGELYNEVPDRVSDVAILVGLGYAEGGHAALGYSAAIAAMFTAYVRAMAVAAGAPNDFCGPMAKPQRMFLVTLVALYCALAPGDWSMVFGRLGGLPGLCLAVITIGSLLTAVRRLLRAARIMRGQNS